MLENGKDVKRKCMLCGRELIGYCHFLITIDRIGYACADDMLCYRANKPKRKKFKVRKRHKKRT